MEDAAIKRNLIDAGCPAEAADSISRLLLKGSFDEGLRKLRICRCDLMEELHQSQRRVDRLDHLIRWTRNEMKANQQE